MHPHLRHFLRDLGNDAPETLLRFARHRRGRGFGHFMGRMADAAGFDRTGFRTGRKLASDDLQLLLLALIAEKPSHGYDLIKLLEERSGAYYVPSPGMIYPALTYLEEAGYVTVEPEGNRKLCRISEQGRDHLERNRARVDALLSQLARINERMADVRHAFADEGEDGEDGELRQARRELRRVLRERKRGSAEESRRIANILRHAIAEITRKQD
jgi:DNA-binding PadR family transcriptional regulator